MLKMLDLFSGIGGFSLAAQMVGEIETKQFVEIDSYCQKVLAKNFPNTPIHDDITTFSAGLGQYDLITGGFPCQDISCANPNGRGLEGERSGLFFELMRIVRQVRPRYLVLENVAEMLRKHNGRIMGTVLKELSESGFDAEWQTISAASVGAPHLRERVFIVAYCQRWRYDGRGSSETSFHGTKPNPSIERSSCAVEAQGLRQADADSGRKRRHQGMRVGSPMEQGRQAEARNRPRKARIERPNPWTVEPGVLRVANGISHRVDRIRGLGNSVVPQVAAIALQRVLELHHGE